MFNLIWSRVDFRHTSCKATLCKTQSNQPHVKSMSRKSENSWPLDNCYLLWRQFICILCNIQNREFTNWTNFNPKLVILIYSINHIKKLYLRKTPFVISTGQSTLLGDPASHPLCNAELPSIENALIVADPEDDASKLASEMTILCDDGYAFADGANSKTIHCERVINEKGRVITQWQDLGGGCKRKFQSKRSWSCELSMLSQSIRANAI